MRLRFFLAAMLLVLFGGWTANAQSEADEVKRVTVGMYINDIQAIDLRTHSYGVDFYLWFRWQGEDWNPVEGYELMNMFDPEGHVESTLYDGPQPQPDGSYYQIIRHQGLFSSKFPVGKYPFDSQRLLVTIEDAEEGAETLQYVPDTLPLVVNGEIKLPGYDLGEPYADIRDKPYATAFGDLSEPDVSAYSRVDFIVPITRPAASGVFKSFIPVLLIVLAAAFALLLDPTHVEARIGLAITALLTLVAMQFTMQAGLPEVAYLTLLDQIYLLSYLYVLIVIGLVVWGTRTDERGDIQGSAGGDARLAKAGPRLAAGVTGVYVLAVLVTVLVNLAG